MLKPKDILREFGAAALVACVSLPICMGLGVVAFAPLGTGMAAAGAIAGLAGGIIAGAIAALFGGTVAQVSAPTVAGAVLLGKLFADLVADPTLGATSNDRVIVAIALGAATIAAAGVLQLLLGLIRAARAVKYIAYPVITGFSAAVAILALRSQLPAFVAATSWDQAGVHDLAPQARGAALVALVTLASFAIARGPLKRLPAALLALVLGTLASRGIVAMFGTAYAAPMIGAIPATMFHLPEIRPFLVPGWSTGFIFELLGTALSIAVLASLETAVSSVTVDGLSGKRNDGERELVGQGFGNIAAGVLGGLSVGGVASLSVLNYKSGGRTKISGIVYGLWLLLLVYVLGSTLAMIPMACLAAIVVVVAWRLLDPWLLRLMKSIARPVDRAERGTSALNLLLVIGVAAVALWAGLVVGVAAGVVASVVLFVMEASRVSLRMVFRGSDVRSKLARPLDQMELLAREGGAIVGVELSGTIFFGSAERFIDAIEKESAGATYVIVGLRHVDRIDATGLRVLRQFREAGAYRSRTIVFADLPRGQEVGHWLAGESTGDGSARALFKDTDAALEWAESALLARQGVHIADGELPLSEIRALKDVSRDDLDWLAPRLVRSEHASGSTLVKEGDRDRTLLLLARGVVEVVAGGQRVASFAAGTMFGELALLDGGARSASVIAVEDTVTYALDWATIEAARRERPALVSVLLMNVGVELSLRLRAASREIGALRG